MTPDNEEYLESGENLQAITESENSEPENLEIAPVIESEEQQQQQPQVINNQVGQDDLPTSPAPAPIELGQLNAQFKIMAGIILRGIAHSISGWLVTSKILPDAYKGEFGDALAPALTVIVLSGGAYLWAWRKAVWDWVAIHISRAKPAHTPFSEIKQEVKKAVKYATPI